MDSLQSIQKAVDYIEEHLMEKITYQDAARHVHMSGYYFHHLFTLAAGYTVTEYIRNRRLSNAGQKILLSDLKVTEVAYQFGYETPASFTKAFQRFHGVTPNVAKRSGCKLQSFNRLVIKIKMEGGTMLEYKIAERKPFTLLVKVRSFTSKTIEEKGNHEISDFWKECGSQGIFKELSHYASNHDTYGVCAPLDKNSLDFEYGIGCEYSGKDIPEGYRLWHITPELWVVFQCKGTDGACIEETWNRFFKEFLPSSDYDMIEGSDFELYPEQGEADSFCELWIPVKRKQ